MARPTSIEEASVRRRPFIGLVSVIALIVAACSPAGVAGQTAEPDPTAAISATESTPPPAAPTTTVPSAPTATVLDGPKLITISWQCEELVDRDFGDLTFTCSAGNIPDIQEFHQGYFNGVEKRLQYP